MRPRELRPVDVLVIGGGPAGSTAAGLLASWGRSALVVHRESGQLSLAESLPASTKKLLRFLGQLDAVDAARFHPNVGNLSRWAGRSTIATSAEAGYHVPRRDFDRTLRDHARAQGAALVEGVVQRVDVASPIRVEILAPDGGLVSCAAGFVLDCSGRAGVVARKGLRRFDVGYRTLAIAAEWECGGWPESERAHTIVDSYAEGWAWSVPLSATRRQCTVMIDRERTAVSKASLNAVYRGELEKAAAIDERLGGARQTGPPWACDASLYGAVRAADDRVLLVGDAASFIEPLSSAGVKKALTSAWRAAVVVNTCLDTPEMWSAASEFHDRREQEVYRECRRRSAAFFADAAAAYQAPFWTVRAGSAPDGTAEGGDSLAADELTSDASIRAAFERLRGAPALGLTPAADVRFGMAATIEGREIVMRDGVLFPGHDGPVRFAAGVNLPDLIRISAGGRDVASVLDAYRSRVGPVDPEALLTGLSVLVARGLLEIRESGNQVAGSPGG